MKWTELKKLVTEEYDRRNLASNVRYRSLDRIEEFIKSLFKFCLVTFLSPPVSPFPQPNRT